MGIIRNHLEQMKAENPTEYKRLMEGYSSEDEFVKEVLGLSTKAFNHYKKSKERKVKWEPMI
jgi:hypothetical protein